MATPAARASPSVGGYYRSGVNSDPTSPKRLPESDGSPTVHLIPGGIYGILETHRTSASTMTNTPTTISTDPPMSLPPRERSGWSSAEIG